MSTPTLQPVEVFIDLENTGIAIPARVDWILDELPKALERTGLKLGAIWTIASHLWAIRKHSGPFQKEIAKAFKKRGYQIVWSQDIADDAIIRTLKWRLGDANFCRRVMLMSDDGHFAPVVRELRKKGCTVTICGHDISKKLAKAADDVTTFETLLGEKVRGITHPFVPEPRPPFNPLSFPETLLI